MACSLEALCGGCFCKDQIVGYDYLEEGRELLRSEK